jgi:hypothetical protein
MLFLNKPGEQLSCATAAVVTFTAVLMHHFNDNVVVVNFHQIFLCDFLLPLPLCVIQFHFNDRVQNEAVLTVTPISVISAVAQAGTDGAMRPPVGINAATTGAPMLLA